MTEIPAVLCEVSANKFHWELKRKLIEERAL